MCTPLPMEIKIGTYDPVTGETPIQVDSRPASLDVIVTEFSYEWLKKDFYNLKLTFKNLIFTYFHSISVRFHWEMALFSHTGKKIVQKLTVTWLWTITVAQDLEKLLEQMLTIVAILLLQLLIHIVVIHSPLLVIRECDHEHVNAVCLATGFKT